MNRDIDVRHVLSAIRVPTLILHRTADASSTWNTHATGAHIPGASSSSFPGQTISP